MPKCPLKILTGYDCPGCGATRAMHAALHGDFISAIHYNLFLIAGIGYAMLAAVATWLPFVSKRKRIRSLILGPASGWIYITLFFAWWIVRNILGV